MAQVDFNGISKGDVGTVNGPCDDRTLPDQADRMVVNFEGKGRANFLKWQLEHANVLAADPTSVRASPRVAASQARAQNLVLEDMDIADAPQAVVTTLVQLGGGEKSLGVKIKEISELKDQGILTEEEFSAAKAKLIRSEN